MQRAAAVVLCMAVAFPALGREVKGREIPEQLELGGRTLKLNGTAVQRKFIFDIYSIALYLERPTRSAREAVYSDQMKRLRLQMLRDADRDQVAGALRDGFRRGNAGRVAGFEDRLEKVLAAIPNMKSGEVLNITHVPGRGIVFETDSGKRMVVPGRDFSSAMFNIWLGADPGTARLKREMLEDPPTRG